MKKMGVPAKTFQIVLASLIIWQTLIILNKTNLVANSGKKKVS